MKLVKGMTMAAALIAISASSAMAGFSVFQAGPINSATPRVIGPGGAGVNNSTFTHNYAGPEFTPGSVRVTGELTDAGVGTWASEARFEVCNPSVCITTNAATATQAFAGTINIGPTVVYTGAGLTGTSIGVWTFEAFESFNDGGNAIDSFWTNLTIEILDATPPPPAFSGNFTGTPNALTPNNKVLGTTIWDHQNPQPGLTDGAGELALGTRYFGSSFDQLGNEVGYLTNHAGGDLSLSLTGLTTDLDLILLDASGTPAGALARSENGGTTSENILLPGAAPGVYYAVVDTFGAANIGSSYSLTYVPEPGTICLLALGVVGLIRRRR